MTYPHGGKYSNDPYFVTDEEELRMEREMLRERAEAACTKPVCEWPHKGNKAIEASGLVVARVAR